MSRYINASDVSKLLGRDYSFHWSTIDDIRRILKSEKNNTDPVKENVSKLSKEDLIKTAEILGCIPNIEKVLKVLDKKKKEISENYHADAKVLEQLPDSICKVVVDDFCMEYGNVQESLILKNRGIKKTNELKYLNFKVKDTWYKIGCRFDGPQIEIKTRKTKLLGVPDYEKVQIHIYMAVAKCKSWTLIEKYLDQEVEHLVNFDQEFFDRVKLDLHNTWETNLKSLF
jgi:hypothetical protein